MSPFSRVLFMVLNLEMRLLEKRPGDMALPAASIGLPSPWQLLESTVPAPKRDGDKEVPTMCGTLPCCVTGYRSHSLGACAYGTHVFTHLFWCIHTQASYGEMHRSMRLGTRGGRARMHGAILHSDNIPEI